MNFEEKKIDRKSISGWGCNLHAKISEINPISIKDLQNSIINFNESSVISRGAGRSYGDAALLNNGLIIFLKAFDHIDLNVKKKRVKVGGGVSIDNLLKIIIPKGFFIPVSPGTRFVTVGGAIASDVHGKNHYLNGSFGNHVIEIKLVDGLGQLRTLSLNKDQNKEARNQFWATIGGMGLTGVVVEATFSLIPIQTSKIIVDTFRYKDLDNLMDGMIQAQKKYQYCVAWVDSLNQKNRGILTCGNHATLENMKTKKNLEEPLKYESKSIASVPKIFHNGVLNKYTVAAFNKFLYRKTPKIKRESFQSMEAFFYPLDGIKNWNKLYGKRGFLQYQFVVPDRSSQVILESLEILRKIGVPSFLTVLKRFGPCNSSFLSFPQKGWTLAIDIPLTLPNIELTLLKLDLKIAKAGGKIYLAKDSRQSSEIFYKTYPRIKDWKLIRDSLDPNNIFCSDLAKRLGMF